MGMAKIIIYTDNSYPRKPAVAFLFSFLIPGLGQVYNGDLMRGIAVALIRTLPLFLLAAVSIDSTSRSCIRAFFLMSAAYIMLTFASALEACIVACIRKELPKRFFNRARWYVLFAIVSILFTCIALLMVFANLAFERVRTDRAAPLLKGGDIVLVRRFLPSGIKGGELAWFDEGRAARVIAREGDLVSYVGNVWLVNRSPLSLGYLKNEDVSRYDAGAEEVLSESTEGRRYPIRFKYSPLLIPKGMVSPIPKGSLLVADDTRTIPGFSRVVPADSIKGRVEGIVYSSRLRMIGIDGYGGLR